MGLQQSKEQLIATAVESQDVSELRTILKDLTPEQIRAVCKSFVPSDENQYTIIHLAAWQDNPDVLAPLLDYADDLEIRDGFGWTPLMTAVNRGSKQNATLLLSRGASIDCDWAGGMSLIADAMNFDDIELVNMLIDRGARVVPTAEMLANGQDQNAFYLLHYAVDDGLFEIARLLIEKGKIPINTLDQAGWSPLHLAAGHDSLEMVTLLLDKGADINIKDAHGNTPLAWATEMNASKVASELKKRGGVADKEWHGDKIELKSYEQAVEEEQEGYDNEQYDDEQNRPSSIATSQFEIEIEEGRSKKQNNLNGNGFNNFDAFQRERSTAKATV